MTDLQEAGAVLVVWLGLFGAIWLLYWYLEKRYGTEGD